MRHEQAATGQMVTMRKLYTTNDLLRFYPRCFLAMTSIAPPFEETTVADRMLILKMVRRKKMTPDGTLIGNLLTHRSRLWGGLLLRLNEDVKAARMPASEVAFRMADWASLARRFADAEGQGEAFGEILGGLAQHQAAQVLENSPLPALLAAWEGDGRWMSTGELHDELAGLAGRLGLHYPFKNTRGLSNHLRNTKVALTTKRALKWEQNANGYVYRVV